MTVRLAMRYHEVDEADVQEWIDHPDVVFEQKFDGTRVLAIVTAAGVEFRQSTGKPLTHAAAKLHLPSLTAVLGNLMLDTPGEMVLDGELLIRTGSFHIFDMPFLGFGGTPLVEPIHPFRHRRKFLLNLRDDVRESHVTVVNQARGPEQKRPMYDAVRAANAEGIIAKSLDGPYEPGKRVKHTVKIKLVKTADVVVTAVDRPDAKHGSFTFGVADFAAHSVDEIINGVPIKVLGKCSAIGKPNARVGDVIEVAYLYREPATGGLVQPRMMLIREDKAAADCTIDQFPDYSREAVIF